MNVTLNARLTNDHHHVLCKIEIFWMIPGDLFPDVSMAREIAQLQVHCPKGCEAILTVSKVETHRCQNSQEPQAPSTGSPCPHCGQMTPLSCNTHRVICPLAPVACPYAQSGCTQR